ncbi:MAG: hypothetical protein KAY27_01220, partial [Pedobacter sp.]|nr:hypothetical protein [Pedobacter sp.]
MKALQKAILLYLVFFLFPLLLHAQQQISLTNINSINGLSQNTIYSTFKDRKGLMWYGTQDGLNRYDGYKIKVYKNKTNSPFTIGANHITSINEDHQSNLWIGTRLGGLSKYIRSTEKFITFRHDPKNPRSLSNNNINAVYTDKKGNVWIGTEDGLNLLDKKTGNFKRFYHHKGDQNSLSYSGILSIFEDSQSNLWVGTYYGLNLLIKNTQKFKRFIGTKTDPEASLVINVIVEDKKRRLWLGTGHGLSLLDPKKGIFANFLVEPDSHSEDGVNPVFCIAKKDDNHLWLGTNTTLQLFNIASQRTVALSEKTIGEDFMPNDGIYSMLSDNKGTLWIGTTSQGVLKYDPNLPFFPAYKSALTNIPSAKNIIREVAEDEKGNLYLATDVGLSYFDRAKKSYTNYQHQKANLASLASDYTTAVLVSKEKKVWVGTFSSGLDCFDPVTKRFKHYTFGTTNKHLSSNSIYVLAEDKKGRIWIGTDWGINVLDPASGLIIKYFHDPKKKQSIADNEVQTIYEDKKGNIWIGGYTKGITILNVSANSFAHLNSENTNLSNDVISQFIEDSKGNLWVGTMEGGLNKYNPNKKSFEHFKEESGLNNNSINFLTEDHLGFLWVSTNQGITRFDPKNVKFRSFKTHNGLKTLEFNFGSGAKLKTGEIVFGSINGFTIVDPRKLPENQNKPEVIINGFSLFNKPLEIGEKESPLKESITVTKTIDLNYRQSVFTIHFAALDYTVP